MDAKGRFFAALDALTPGNRDGNLVRVATYGLAAGLSPSEVAEAIMSGAPGGTRPDPAAVRRAVENCYGATRPRTGGFRPSGGFSLPPRKTEAQRLEEFRRSLPDEVRQSVRRLIDASLDGATPDALILASPTPVPTDPREQAAAHLDALGADWRWKTWVGTISQERGKRGIVAEPFLVAWAIKTRLCPRIPTHVTLNPLTGEEGLTKDGKPSFDCAASVAALRFMLVEFDELPLREQLALWVSVVRFLRDEVPLVSIVYSGGKSIHAVVLNPPKTKSDLWRETVTDADRADYRKAWDALMRRFASSPDAAERMDLAPSKNAAVHTRVAGAFREGTGRYQKLLYLDAGLARRNLEIF